MDIEGIISKVLAAGADLSTRTAVKRTLKGIVDDDEILDRVYIAIKNRSMREAFSRVPVSKRALFLPACLRNSQKCEAEMLPEKEYVCRRCESCVVSAIIEKAEKLGYRHIYIVPGGSLVMKIIKEGLEKREILGVVGVACNSELVEASEKLSIFGLPHQGVPLLKTGCVNTLVDVDEVIRVLRLGVDGKKVC